MEKLAIQTTTTSKLNPNPWNTNVVLPEAQSKIEESIRRFGMFKPLVCRELENGRLEIIGGQHRWEAAKSLGMEEVPIVNLGLIDDRKAKEISLVDNGRYGSDDSQRLAELLRELGTTDELAEYLPYAVGDLAQIFSSTEVNLDDLSMDDEEEIEEQVQEITKKSPMYQVMRFKVPVDDADFVRGVIDGISERQGFISSDSLTNAGDALVWLCGRQRDAKEEE